MGSTVGQHSVFVYGSLLENEMLRVLLGRVPPSSPALLRGYNRFSISGCSYPAIIPVEGKSVDGKVLSDITDSELDVLDVFEDLEYVKTAVEISTGKISGDHRGEFLAYTYVWVQKDDSRLQGDWDFNEWKKKHFEEFHKMAVRFADEYKSPKSRMGRLQNSN